MSGDWSDREVDEGNDRGVRAVDRELERLRTVYQQHAEALSRLAASAPTKALSRKYSDLIGEINRSILGLEDPGAIARRSSAERSIEPSRPAPPPHRAHPPTASDVHLRTEPGRVEVEPEPSALGRIVLILGMAILVICLLAFFVWKFGGEPRTETTRAPEAAVAATETAAPAPSISILPEAQDFGVVYKGTRVAKAFKVTNHTDRDVTIEAERSKCRCLWFDYTPSPLIPAGGTVELSVAVDGGRAEVGLVSEAVVVFTKEQPRLVTEAEVTADIR